MELRLGTAWKGNLAKPIVVKTCVLVRSLNVMQLDCVSWILERTVLCTVLLSEMVLNARNLKNHGRCKGFATRKDSKHQGSHLEQRGAHILKYQLVKGIGP